MANLQFQSLEKNQSLPNTNLLQQQSIQESSNKLLQIHPRESISTLQEEFKHNQKIQIAVENIKQQFTAWARIRGDGNCYFRAAGYAILEHCLRCTTPSIELTGILQKFQSAQGYFQIRLPTTEEHFQLRNQFIVFLEYLINLKKQNPGSIHQILQQSLKDNQSNFDEALVWEMRTVTANYLEAHSDFYENFTVQFQNEIKNVLTMGKEAESLGIGCLQVVFNIKINIIMLERNLTETKQFEQIKISGYVPQVHILYKPGHYDLIYPVEFCEADGFDAYNQRYTGQIRHSFKNEQTQEPFYIFENPTESKMPQNNYVILQQKIPITYASTQQQIQLSQQPVQTSYGSLNTENRSRQSSQPKPQTQQPQNKRECDNPNCGQQSQQVISLDCHHNFCTQCLQNHVNRQTEGRIVSNENEKGFKIFCPQNCNVEIQGNKIASVFGETAYIKAVQEAQNRAYKY